MSNKHMRMIIAAMDAYLGGQGCDGKEFERQVQSDLNLALQCFKAALKVRQSEELNVLAEQVAYDVLNWYPTSTRTKIALYLVQAVHLMDE